MLSDTEEQAEESENYFISMTDMMVGMLFIFIIMLMVFALNYRKGDNCLTAILTKNAKLSHDITENVNKIQNDVRDQIEALELAADQRRRLLADISQRLIEQGLAVQVDQQNGVLRLTEEAVLFASTKSVLDAAARSAVGKVGKVLNDVVSKYTACEKAQADVCDKSASLDTIFIEGHTDSTGDDQSNWILSTERATATYREMLAGHPALRDFRNRHGEQIISVSGYSSTRPIAQGNSKESWTKNRRIDLRFVMDADITINLRDIIALNDEVKAQIGRLAEISQESINACK